MADARLTRRRARGHGAELFRGSPARAYSGWLLLAAVVVGALASLARQPGAGALDTVWAEDGAVFLSTAWSMGSWDTVWAPYAGYVHVLPRVLTEIAVLFPVGWTSEVLALEAAILTGAMAVLVFHVAAAHLPSRTARFVSAAPIVLLPLGQDDLPNAVANLHWPALYVTFWMLLWIPRGTPLAVLVGVATSLTGASDIVAVLFVPLALARLRSVPGPRGWLPSVGLLLGLCVQLVVRVVNEAPRELSPTLDPVWAAAGVVGRMVPLSVLGDRWVGEPGGDAGFLAVVVAAWTVVAAFCLLALAGGLARRSFLWVALAHALALYVVPIVLSGVLTPRYIAAPAMLLVAAGAYVVSESGSAWRRRAALGALALVVVVWGVNFRVDNRRADGPTWTDAVQEARQACDRPSIESALEPITPEGWSVRIPCERLAPGSGAPAALHEPAAMPRQHTR